VDRQSQSNVFRAARDNIVGAAADFAGSQPVRASSVNAAAIVTAT
jgi:hypothetical protein